MERQIKPTDEDMAKGRELAGRFELHDFDVPLAIATALAEQRAEFRAFTERDVYNTAVAVFDAIAGERNTVGYWSPTDSAHVEFYDPNKWKPQHPSGGETKQAIYLAIGKAWLGKVVARSLQRPPTVGGL